MGCVVDCSLVCCCLLASHTSVKVSVVLCCQLQLGPVVACLQIAPLVGFCCHVFFPCSFFHVVESLQEHWLLVGFAGMVCVVNCSLVIYCLLAAHTV